MPAKNDDNKDKQMSKTCTKKSYPAFQMENWHKDYRREVAKEVKEHCMRVERAWEFVRLMGNRQLEGFGHDEDSLENETWGKLCFDAELSDLRTQYMNWGDRAAYLRDEFRAIKVFWSELSASQPDVCTCDVIQLEILMENLRP